MDANLIFIWIIGLNCAIGIVRVRRLSVSGARGWLTIYASVLAALVALVLVIPAHAGLWLAPVWVAFLFAPAIGQVGLSFALSRGSFGIASALARLLVWLHPFDGWRDYPRFVALSRCLHLGEIESARSLIERISSRPSPFSRAARVMSVGLTGDWVGYCHWIEANPERDALLRDANLLAGYLGALGRTGRRSEMLARYREFAEPMLRRWPPAFGVILRLSVLTQCGRVESVTRLLEHSGGFLSLASRMLYVAEAELIRGDRAAAERFVATIVGDPTAAQSVKLRAERLLAKTVEPIDLDQLEPSARAALDSIVREVEEDAEFGVPTSGAQGRPIATLSVAAILVAVFLLELQHGDPMSSETLIDLGALVLPTDATPGEWWRRLTSGFLHFGHWHLIMNVCGLLLLGNWLERAWGRWRFTACYLASIVVSGALLPVLEAMPSDATHLVFVGASGGVMGILGGLLGRLVVGRMFGGSRMVRRQLTLLVAIVAMQTVFDLSVPQVSTTAHLLGLFTGLPIGLWFTLRSARTERTPPRDAAVR